MAPRGLLLVFIIFFVFCVNSNATQAVQNGDPSQLLLRKLGFKVSELEYYKRRSLNVNPGRIIRSFMQSTSSSQNSALRSALLRRPLNSIIGGGMILKDLSMLESKPD
ncbi:hypothetical protein L6452_20646 [Arctium lappa]|uniref:Uncharacterized protein n=1 Tax=Arctium lappa TaxID=4217 RepID=A0ACB9BCG8_ARCLA|nr:hypothetical protein L6452_20646 [Arctium lappa]